MARTLVSFHAHPDDEALLTAGSLARATHEGNRVVLVFATRGEVGDADPAILAPDEDLAERRVREAAESAAALGVDRVVFLGYRDSGGSPGGNPPAPGAPGTFSGADLDEAAGRLAALLAEEGADVLTTYDPNGGYGHPDHCQVHVVGQRGAELAGTPVVLEATLDRALLRMAVDLAPTLGVELPEGVALPDTSGWYSSADEITHRIDVTPFLAQKRRSMEAHASQTTSASSPFRSLALFLSLPDEWFSLAFGTEWFVDRSLPPPKDGLDLTDDLFANVDRRRAG